VGFGGWRAFTGVMSMRGMRRKRCLQVMRVPVVVVVLWVQSRDVGGRDVCDEG
jgi:hypothetical protein